ncbi:SDR family NAD(P)-dependent oxidoreductase [Flavihumibacter petaseus]|uniref:Putative oxidoreductase n=1 Tax=Flavihumibacter petaseus NBRC 106054 TaxID=1220578 RepID=A0A0E9N0P1_9BACT|nr:SDR family oxidoreductase [Flavihumibacter petaseus]GAO43211.1 putative oxidoreductase [Flavihumibacter petaseus NBRC 106054]
MLLKGKNAVVFGAAGSLGTALSKAFAKEGATVYLSGRRLQPVQALTDEIIAGGGKAYADQVDALVAGEVNSYVDRVAAQAGRIDLAINLISLEDRQNMLLTEMAPEDFERPVQRATRTHFLTATAVARKMIPFRSGVILSLTATPGGIGYALTGGFGPACCVMESFSRNLAAELGIHNIRVVNIRSGGSPDSRVFREAIEQGGDRTAAFIDKIKNDTMLKAMPLMQDIADAAVFLASDKASRITGVTLDVTAGTTAALNYKMTDIAFLEEEDNRWR